MPKVYLSPSNQGSNACKHGDSELDHCNLLVDALIPYLEASGIEYKRAGRTETIAARVKASNDWHADVHYCIHTNAGGGARSVLYGWNKADATWLRLAAAIKKYRAELYTGEIRYAQNRSFYEIKNTQARCMYDEVLFHDNAAEAAFLHDNLDGIARAIALGLCEYFMVSFKEPGDAQEAGKNAEAEEQNELLTLRARVEELEKQLDSAYSRLAAIAAIAVQTK